jgi:diguanylate cyclase (GGDEF)-like protein/PAS domain S-box-containing protein
MQTAPTPGNEQERLRALYAAEILDTPAEEDFDGVARLAAAICEVPIARVSLVDADRQWFKACVGDDTSQTPRDISFCGHAIMESDLFIVEDAREDERFADNPQVLGDERVRFYAGAPLITSDGQALGSLCVIDHEPRQLTEAQEDALRTLGRQVVGQLELRQREAEMRISERRFRTLTHSAPVGIFETDENGACTFINEYLSELIGRTSDEVRGDAWIESIYLKDRERVYTAWMQAVADEGEFTLEYRFQRPDGTTAWVQGSAVAVRESSGEVTGYLGTCLDIAERKKLEQQRREEMREVEAMAHTDQLTQLPNRRWWDSELRRTLATAARTKSELCVALVDIDRFKRFNDENGHPGGDRLLRTAATVWKEVVRAQDFVARYGGEEFAVLLPGCSERAAAEVVERLRAATPMGQTVSAGIAAWKPWESPGSLIARADEALYQAKRAGRDRAVRASSISDAGAEASYSTSANGHAPEPAKA